MSNIPEPEPEEPEDTSWLATYGDMVTLLLVFFVLLVSMSTVEVKTFPKRFRVYAHGFRRAYRK